MQTVAQGLLVLELTHSGTSLGFVTALQTLPVLLFGPWGGVVADRFPKRPVLYITQTAAGIQALLIGILLATDTIQIWMLYVLAFCFGLVNTVDNPTRQTFVMEMVGRETLTNAVSLNSTQVNLARVVGPSLAAALIATVGMTACFIINGLSYFVVVFVLMAMKAGDLYQAPLVTRARGQLSQGWRYVRSTPILRTILVMMTLIGMFTYEFTVSLPLLAQGSASVYAAMTSAMGLGAVFGGLYTASRPRGEPQTLVRQAVFFGIAVLLTALAPTVPLSLLALLGVGFFSIRFTALGNSTLQLESLPEMRGRVMSLWTMTFLGTTPIGGPIIGWIGEHWQAHLALLVGAVACFAAAVYGAWDLGREAAVVNAEAGRGDLGG
jgi:MFS family permease